MMTDATLLERIFTLTRGDLETATFPVPDPRALLSESETVRIRRVTQFWRQGETSTDALLHHTAALLSAFHAQDSHCAFVLRGSASRVECWVGAQSGQFNKPSVGAVVRGVLPDARIDVTTSLFDTEYRYPYGSVFTGAPLLRTAGERLFDQIEVPLRALVGRNWMFVVRAVPRPVAIVAQNINQLSHEIRDVRSTLLLNDSPLGGDNRIAQRYAELLELKLQRFELGRTQGMWDAQIAFLADTPITLNVGRGLFQSAFSGDETGSQGLRACRCSPTATAAPPLEPITTRELAILTRVPQEEYPGYEVVEHTRYGVDVDDGLASERDLFIGDVLDRGQDTGNSLRIRSADLTKHVLITGVTGSGKTTSCISLLKQVWNGGRGVPFLVIESAKSEYRNLMRSPELDGLRVYTVADETIAPLRMNPFEVPEGVLIQTHIDYVKSLFSAAFVLYPPMPYVLEQSIQEIYEDRGWDLARNDNRRGRSKRSYPRLADLSRKIAHVVDRMGYDTRITMDIKAGLLARVNQLRLGGGKGLMLDCRTSTPATELFASPCILELKNLVSDDEKAFLIGLLLIRLHEHCETTRAGGRGLRHVTVIEEAHRLLRNTSIEQGAESANPRGRAIEVFTNILSEIRAYGEAIVIAEQIPAKLTPDAVKNTGTKIVHRLLAEDDRELVGQAMNLDVQQMRGVARLQTGEAVVFTEDLQKAVLLRMARDAVAIEPVSDREVESRMAAKRATHNECVASARNGHACSDHRIRIDFADVSSAFRRFVNAARLAPTNAGPYLEAVVRALRLHKVPAESIPCAIGTLAEDECESRGSLADWSFDEVDRSIHALLDDCDAIESGAQAGGRFADVGARLYSAVQPAYAGCIACPRVCWYRFDAFSGVSSEPEFGSAFMDKKVSFQQLARLSIAAVSPVMPREGSAGHEAALCFSVMQLDRLQLSATNQIAAARRIARSLGVE
jgi:DNA helicase HerA-like ATPase